MFRRLPTAFLARRSFAADTTSASADKLSLTLALPHQIIFKGEQVVQVNLPTSSGEVGILAKHVPSLFQLKPGVLQVIGVDAGLKEFFAGFAQMNPDSNLIVNALEAVPLDQISREDVAKGLSETAAKLGNASLSELEKAELEVFQEVFQALNAAVNKQ